LPPLDSSKRVLIIAAAGGWLNLVDEKAAAAAEADDLSTAGHYAAWPLKTYCHEDANVSQQWAKKLSSENMNTVGGTSKHSKLNVHKHKKVMAEGVSSEPFLPSGDQGHKGGFEPSLREHC
jgi:hypothetical protein